MNAQPTTNSNSAAAALQLTLAGRVQGLGVRPAIARWAGELGLCGRVVNTRQGVEARVEGPEQQVRRFQAELARRLPASAVVDEIHCQSAEPSGDANFTIVESRDRGPVGVRAPQDLAVCSRCLREVASDSNRRGQYPFTSCTDCGPRYSIIDRLPYERAQTTMSRFSLCSQCMAEYQSPSDPRFHAQTNACPACGPGLWCCDGSGRKLAAGPDALRAAAAAIRNEQILALRGLGGYQLIVDASSPKAVARLRQRKQRCGKPLAVMVESMQEADRLAVLSECERQALSSPAAPIVVVPSRPGGGLAAAVSPGLDTVGLMLPTTPLHWLLLRRCRGPLVATSGNGGGEPLAYDDRGARATLRGVADLWLDHDRPILRPIDDSVIRVISGRGVTIRLGRGCARAPLELPRNEPLLAVGGQQKVALALSNGAQSVLGPHVGDLDTLACRERFIQQTQQLQQLFGSPANRVVADKHPDYFTTRWSEQEYSSRQTVQHHHAHVVAGMLEQGWLDRTVLGVAFDGTGFGDDGSVWGGEFLLSSAADYRRVGHLRAFRLPGGEAAVREPWRVAVALARQACGAEQAFSLPLRSADAASLKPIVDAPRFSPLTTSAGRLFDGVAALVLGVERSEFEGQPAMLLESICDPAEPGSYVLDLRVGERAQLDWRPMIASILSDRQRGASPAAMAMRFHRALASAIASFCQRFPHLPVVLGGGVFQNRVLVELLERRFAVHPQPLGLPGLIPPNDGGLAAGQLAVAIWRSAGL